MTVWLHADEAGMGMDQRFLLKLSVTREAPRILALNGNAIADGRPIGALAKRDPMPLGPAAGSVVSTDYKYGRYGNPPFIFVLSKS